jgi:NhaA family Na+:H+ antiporter
MAAVLALILANSPLSWIHAALIELPVQVRIGGFSIDKPLLLWINDGLMAVFFLLVGLELKREFFEGSISELRQAALPLFGAVGGMLVPALVYVAINHGDPVAIGGWAIPAATDIAFALAILGLLGSRVPVGLRVLLVSIAIFDDLGAIIIIALFYTSELTATALGTAFACFLVLLTMNRIGVLERAPYLFVGMIMWAALLKSGVHATLAGVVLALCIPIRSQSAGVSPLHELEHDLHALVAYFILPLFAFANAGISFVGFGLEQFMHPIPLGVAAGLFIGKQLGVFLFCFAAVHSGVARLPAGLGWAEVYGVALLCGVGFTMSLFIASLAFEHTRVNLLYDERIGILTCGVFCLSLPQIDDIVSDACAELAVGAVLCCGAGWAGVYNLDQGSARFSRVRSFYVLVGNRSGSPRSRLVCWKGAEYGFDRSEETRDA